MSKQVLNVELREQSGKGISRRLRVAGRIPAIVYGKGMESVTVSVATRELSEAIAGEGGRNHILTLKGAGALDGQAVIVADLLQDGAQGLRAVHTDQGLVIQNALGRNRHKQGQADLCAHRDRAQRKDRGHAEHAQHPQKWPQHWRQPSHQLGFGDRDHTQETREGIDSRVRRM